MNQNLVQPTGPNAPAAEGDTFTLSGTSAAFRKLGPSLFVVGIATGIAFAIGAAIADRLISSFLPGRR